MNHPTLGRLERKDDCFEGELQLDGNKIGLSIELDAAPQDKVLKFSESVVTSIECLEEKAKSVINRDLLETYNSAWKEYDEVQEDGSTKTVINPELNSEQFVSHFELDSISICGADCVEFWFKPNNLFWGHSVFVTSFDGVEFGDANAQMFG